MLASDFIRPIEINENDIICGDFGAYRILKITGKGNHAKVARCVDIATSKIVALKISHLRLSRAIKHEAFVLQKLSGLNKRHVVKCINSFKYKGHYILVLESLDRSLDNFLREREFKPLHLCEIRYIAEQLLVALKGLSKHGIVHADLKPDNIMLVNHESDPFWVKLIDLGSSKNVSCLTPRQLIQPIGYRAPEVMLGYKLGHAIDMWSLGCVLAYLYIGQHLYPIRYEHEYMRIITQIQGLPEDHILEEGLFTCIFFSKRNPYGVWKLRRKDEYTYVTGKQSKECTNYSRKYTCLEDMKKNHPKPQTKLEEAETEIFFRLLKQMLHLNPEKRITPDQALKHPFITQKPPSGPSLRSYIRALITSSPCYGDSDKSSSSSSSFFSESESGSASDDVSKPLQVKDRVPTGPTPKGSTDSDIPSKPAAFVSKRNNYMARGKTGKPFRDTNMRNFRMASTSITSNSGTSKGATAPTFGTVTDTTSSKKKQVPQTRLRNIGHFFRHIFRCCKCNSVSVVDD